MCRVYNSVIKPSALGVKHAMECVRLEDQKWIDVLCTYLQKHYKNTKQPSSGQF